VWVAQKKDKEGPRTEASGGTSRAIGPDCKTTKGEGKPQRKTKMSQSVVGVGPEGKKGKGGGKQKKDT